MAEKQKKVKNMVSPIGTAKWAWVNKPKTTFKKDGEYTLSLIVPVDEAQSLIEIINEMTDAHFNETYNGLKEKDRKQLKKHYPFSNEETDEGEETGNIEFKFRVNATYEKDGQKKTFAPAIVDKMGRELDREKHLVYGGSIVRVSFNPSAYYNSTNKTVGVTLYLNGVQVLKFATRDRAASLGFTPVTDGEYADDEDEGGQFDSQAHGGDDGETSAEDF
jgi:hypothetical protein